MVNLFQFVTHLQVTYICVSHKTNNNMNFIYKYNLLLRFKSYLNRILDFACLGMN